MVPLHGLGVILADALAGFVEDAQIELRGRISLICRFAKPLGGLTQFLRHTEAGLVANAQITLRGGIILLRRFAQPTDRLISLNPTPRPARSGSRMPM